MQAASSIRAEVGLAFTSTPARGAPLVCLGAPAVDVAELYQRQAGLSEIVSSLALETGRLVRVRASRSRVRGRECLIV